MFAQLRLDGLVVSNNIIQMSTHRSGKSALEEFLPERALAPAAREGRLGSTITTDLIPPEEVQLDAIENCPSAPALKPAPVEVWPMLAAALVTLGFGILVLATFATFFDPSL
jgi:hypothetical protein